MQILRGYRLEVWRINMSSIKILLSLVVITTMQHAAEYVGPAVAVTAGVSLLNCAIESYYNPTRQLARAIEKSDLQAVAHAIQRGARVSGNKIHAPLVLAAKKGNLAILHHLVLCGADVRKVDSTYTTPLEMAIDKNHAHIVDYLTHKTKAFSSAWAQVQYQLLLRARERGRIIAAYKESHCSARDPIGKQEWVAKYIRDNNTIQKTLYDAMSPATKQDVERIDGQLADPELADACAKMSKKLYDSTTDIVLELPVEDALLLRSSL